MSFSEVRLPIIHFGTLEVRLPIIHFGTLKLFLRLEFTVCKLCTFIRFLLNTNSELLAEVGDFIKQSTELQK